MAETPIDSAINFTWTADATQVVGEANKITIAVKQAEDGATLLGKALSSFTTTMGGIATGAFGIMSAVLKAPIDLSNYMGQLNQKITQVGGELNRYKSIHDEFMLGKMFKPGEGGFGLSEEEFNKVMKQFATGTTAVEKYGTTKKKNFEGFAGGAGMAMQVLGFDPTQASNALTDLHKTIGLTFNEMEPFVKTMGNIGKSANMTSDQFYSLTRNVSKLAKAYNLNGEAGKKFVSESLSVGAALSQIGLDAEKTLSKMNEISTGSERGLIQSLLLGFSPNDPGGQLKAFENQAKTIVATAASAGEQFAPMVTRMMADAMGMEGFSVEDINRMASGMKTEGKDRPASEILQEISDTLKNPERQKESPFITAAKSGNEALNAIHGLMQHEFMDALKQGQNFLHDHLKPFVTKMEGWIETFKSWVKGFDDFFGLQNSALGSLTKAAIGLAAVIPVLKFTGGLIEGFGKGIALKALGAAAPAAVADAGAALAAAAAGGGLAAALSVAIPVIITGLVAWGIGTWIRKNFMTQKQNEEMGDAGLYGNQDTERGKQLAKEGGVLPDPKNISERAKANLAKAGKATDYAGRITGGVTEAAPVAEHVGDWRKGAPSTSDYGGQVASSNKKTTLSKDEIYAIAAAHGLPAEGFYNQMMAESSGKSKAVSKKGAIGIGQLMPATAKELGVTDPYDPYQNANASAKYMAQLVKKYDGDYTKAVSAYQAGMGNVAHGTHLGPENAAYVAKVAPAYKNAAAGGLNKVHDEGANAHLASIDNGINGIKALLNQQPALVGSPTSNYENDSLASQLFGSN